MRYLAILTLILALTLSFVGCSKAENSTGTVPEAPTVNNGAGVVINPGGSFRSDNYYLTVELPPDWAAAEGTTTLARPIEGHVAFNSWNQPGFWAREIQDGNSFKYNRQTVGSQVPDGGAYVALVRIQGPAPVPPYNSPEYTANDLDGLWTPHDARQDGGSFIEFYKWGRSLSLEVYCSPNASDATVAALNALLKSWRFDEIPAGDAEWAQGQARRLLPDSVGPLWFPMYSGRTDSENVSRATEIELRGKTVHFRFIYSWGKVSLPSPSPSRYYFKDSHWWEINVLPTGEAVLSAEGGDALPQ